MTDTVKDDIQATLKRLSRTVVIVCVALVLTVVAGVVVTLASNAHIRDLANTTNAALCTLRGDLEQRVEDSRQFLRDHPNGIPGISAADIQQGISNQQRTIDALSPLRC